MLSLNAARSTPRAAPGRWTPFLAALLGLVAVSANASSLPVGSEPTSCSTPAMWTLNGDSDKIGFVNLADECVLRVTGKNLRATYSMMLPDAADWADGLNLSFRYSVIDRLSGSDKEEGLRVEASGVSGMSAAQFTLNTLGLLEAGNESPLLLPPGAMGPAKVSFTFSDTSGVGFYLYSVNVRAAGAGLPPQIDGPAELPEPTSAALVAAGLLLASQLRQRRRA